MKIELTGTFVSTYDIEPEHYQAVTNEGMLSEDINAFDEDPSLFLEFDDFEVTVTGRLVQ